MTQTIRIRTPNSHLYRRAPDLSRRSLRRQREIVDHVNACNWYVLTVTARRAIWLKEEMERIGVDAMLPVEYRWTRRGMGPTREREMKPYPAFPGYLFVHCQLSMMAILFDYESVHGVIGRDGMPEALPGQVITRLEGMRFYESAQGRFTADALGIDVGDKAEIVRGAFMGYVVEVDAIRKDKDGEPQGQADAVLDMFGKVHKVTLGLGDLKKID